MNTRTQIHPLAVAVAMTANAVQRTETVNLNAYADTDGEVDAADVLRQLSVTYPTTTRLETWRVGNKHRVVAERIDRRGWTWHLFARHRRATPDLECRPVFAHTILSLREAQQKLARLTRHRTRRQRAEGLGYRLVCVPGGWRIDSVRPIPPGAPTRCADCGRVHAPTDDAGNLTDDAVRFNLARRRTCVENPHAPGGWTFLTPPGLAPAPTTKVEIQAMLYDTYPALTG